MITGLSTLGEGTWDQRYALSWIKAMLISLRLEFYQSRPQSGTETRVLPVLVLSKNEIRSATNQWLLKLHSNLHHHSEQPLGILDLLYVLFPCPGELVAQFKFTVLLMPNGPQR